MSLILTPAQAKAVYDAMCALNNVGAKITVKMDNPEKSFTNVFETPKGEVKVCRGYHFTVLDDEEYANQSAFAAAYGVS